MPGQFSQLLMRACRVLVFATAALTACVAATSAQARWLKAESPLFAIYSEGGEKELRNYTQRLEEYDGLLRTMTGTTAAPSPNKLTIYLVRNNAQLREISAHAGPDVQGLYLALTSGTLAIAVREDIGSSKWLSAQSIMFHEYTHHFVYQYYPAQYPQWTSEGLAEYFSSVKFKPETIEVGQFQLARVYPLRTKDWLPVAQLFNPPPGKNMNMFYPESWLVTHYMMDDSQRRTQLHSFLQDIGRGEDTAAAFQANFGMDFKAFDKVMKKYLAKGQVLVRAVPRNAVRPEVVITEMPAAADELLLPGARFIAESMLPVEEEDRAMGSKTLTQVRKEAAKFPDDALAQRTLAAGEMLYGSYDTADAILDKLLAQRPNDLEALYTKAARYVVQAERAPALRAELLAKVKPLAGRIDKLDPNHYPSLYLYALGALADGKPPSENTLNVLKLAHKLAPQVDEISLEAAIALSKADQPKDARHLFEMVAYGPNANSRSRYARRLLSQVGAGQQNASQAADKDGSAQKVSAEK